MAKQCRRASETLSIENSLFSSVGDLGQTVITSVPRFPKHKNQGTVAVTCNVPSI